MGGGYFILLKRIDLRGLDTFGYLRYLLLNELDCLKGNLSCYTISKVSQEKCRCRREFPLFLV
jgi:hypothetical protein